MRVLDSVVMPGGWHYEQPLVTGSPQKPQHQRIEGATYNDLVERALTFRQLHLELVPSGTATRERVEADLAYWICGRWPTQCTGTKGELVGDPARVARTYTPPIHRLEDWLARLSSQPLEWVDVATATARARVCMGCPLNQRWQTGCGSCNNNVVRRALLVRGSNRTGFEGQLKGCLAYGWLNELAVWLKDQYVVTPVRKPIIDCWKRKEIEATRAEALNT